MNVVRGDITAEHLSCQQSMEAVKTRSKAAGESVENAWTATSTLTVYKLLDSNHSVLREKGLEVNTAHDVERYESRIWNSYMKSLNGNIKQSINISHWNGGSSHLARSKKGKDKIKDIKFLLNKYDIFMCGISEANLHKTVDEHEYKVDKYKS